jgi:FlaA1/EpsC-like NDP-sugar epimerase
VILVTGAAGSVGQALCTRLDPEGHVGHDINSMDVTALDQVRSIVRALKPHTIYHLAGAKHAPEGELDPAHVAQVNIDGTLNVLEAAEEVGAKSIFSSTCKACDPETAYGASKLIAERAVINAGGVVIRFHNIPESSGNVFRIWESLPERAPLPVTDCWRYFTPMAKAVELLLAAPTLDPGRYCVEPGDPQWMPNVAKRLYPDRKQVRIPRRRGDRFREPLHALCEEGFAIGSWLRIVSAHDPVHTAARAA